jgi:hypothetical protein
MTDCDITTRNSKITIFCQTPKEILVKVGKVMGNSVTNHTPTKNNSLGQSGIHTVLDDIITVVLNSESEQEAFRNLSIMFTE